MYSPALQLTIDSHTYPSIENHSAEVISVYGEFISRSLVIHSPMPAFVALNVILSTLMRLESYKAIPT